MLNCARLDESNIIIDVGSKFKSFNTIVLNNLKRRREVRDALLPRLIEYVEKRDNKHYLPMFELKSHFDLLVLARA